MSLFFTVVIGYLVLIEILMVLEKLQKRRKNMKLK